MKTGFLGAGKMAEGILQAMLAGGASPKTIIMAERDEERGKMMAKKYGVTVTQEAAVAAKTADVIFIAVRPQDVGGVAAAVKPILTERKLVVSIVAGKTLAKLRGALGTKARMIRVMPNLALRVGAGMCAIAGAKNATKADIRRVSEILGGAGEVVELRERDFDAVTALSGSGPAYFAYMEAAMVEGGVRLGLKKQVARLLAEQTMYGTAKFLRESKMELGEFISGVCTKGGTTAAGMTKLETPTFKRIVAATLAAAAKRSKELAK